MAEGITATTKPGAGAAAEYGTGAHIDAGAGTKAAAGRSGTSRLLHVGWVMPPFFHELPVDIDDADDAAERLFDMVKDVLAFGTEDERFRMFVLYAGLVGELRDAGAVYAGFCAIDMGGGRPSTASVAVYRLPLENMTADEALSETSSGLQRAYPGDDVRITDLSCGKAVVRIGDAPFTLSAEASPTGEPIDVPRGQIQVYFPLPNGADLLVFEFSTPCMEDWDFYSELFAEILRTLDLATEEEAQMAAVLSQASPIPDATPDPVVVQELYAHSSRVLDGLAVRGRTDLGDQVSAVTCPDCWGKGLRSACTARHQWQIDEVEEPVLVAALGRLDERLQASGWVRLVRRQEGQSVSLAADGGSGHRVGAVILPGRRRLIVEVTAPCGRTVRGPKDSAFG